MRQGGFVPFPQKQRVSFRCESCTLIYPGRATVAIPFLLLPRLKGNGGGE